MLILNQICQVAVVSFSSSSAQTVVAAVTNGKIRVYALYIMVGGATNMTFNDGVQADGGLPFAANGQLVLDHKASGEPWFQTGTGSAFTITTASAVSTVGRVYYTTGS